MRIRNGICILLAVFLLAGCGSDRTDAQEKKDIKIGVSVYNQSDTCV